MYNDVIKSIPQNKPAPEDYEKDGIIYCGKCNTPKQTKNDWFGIVSIPCACQTKAIEERELKREQKQIAERVTRLRQEAFLDIRSKEYTFDIDDGGDAEASRIARCYVENWKEMKQKNAGLLFMGAVGTGKSFLSCCIANALIDKEVSVFAANLPELMRAVENYERREDTLNRISKCGLQIIDDLGAERDTPYSLERLFDIVDTRYRSNKPLIVTTNLTPAELRNPGSRERERIYDRIIEMCPIQITVNGNQRRKGVAIKKAEEAKRILGIK